MQSQTPAPEIAHVYIVENSLGLIKIGIAGNPGKRIRTLEVASGAPIVRRHISPPNQQARELEAALHRHFADKRQAGEWFAISFDAAVSALAEHLPQFTPSQPLAPFEFQGHAVRTLSENGETWFVARDVCDCLELTDTSKSLERLRDSEKLIRKIFVSGQHRETWLVNEPGLYRLIFTSNKPEAQTFQDWVYHEVLPALRKTGAYAMPVSPELRAAIQATIRAEIRRSHTGAKFRHWQGVETGDGTEVIRVPAPLADAINALRFSGADVRQVVAALKSCGGAA